MNDGMAALTDFFALAEPFPSEESGCTAVTSEVALIEKEIIRRNVYQYVSTQLLEALLLSLLQESGMSLYRKENGASDTCCQEVIGSDYLITACCHFCATCSAEKVISKRIVAFIDSLADCAEADFIISNLSATSASDKPSSINDLLSLLSKAFSEIWGEGVGDIDFVAIRLCLYLLQRDPIAAYKLVFQLMTSIFSQLPKDDQSESTYEDSKLLRSVDLARAVCQLQLTVSMLDAIGRDQCHSNLYTLVKHSEDDNSTHRILMDSLLDAVKQFLLMFRSLVPMMSYCVRTALLFLSLHVKPDLTYIMLQHGYKVLWSDYLHSVEDLEHSWNSLVYARKHSKVDLWKAIDPDWSDEGYQYVFLLSREEAFAMLKEKPIGSFMLLPQELENGCPSFVLIYRANIAEKCRSVILRRERLSASSPIPTSTANGENVPQESSSGNKDDPPRLSPPLSSEASIEGSSVTSPVSSPKYAYRCGKYGPNNNLLETLKGLAKIIPDSLDFQPVLPPSLPLPGNDLFAPQLDLNAPLWLDLRDALPRWVQTITLQTPAVPHPHDHHRRMNADADSEEGGGSDDDSSDSGDTAYSSESDTPTAGLASPTSPNGRTNISQRHNSTASVLPSSNNISKKTSTAMLRAQSRWRPFDPEYLHDLNQGLTSMLAVRRFAEQSVPLALLVEKVFRLDIEHLRSHPTYSSEVVLEEILLTFHLCLTMLQEDFTPSTTPSAPETYLRLLLNENGNDTERYHASHSTTVLALLLPCITYVDAQDRHWRPQILPPPPTTHWQVPVLKFVPAYEHITSTYLYKAAKNYFSREAVLVDKLAQHLLEVLPVRTLKLPEGLLTPTTMVPLAGHHANSASGGGGNAGGNSSGECLVPDCVSATDVAQLVGKWREILLWDLANTSTPVHGGGQNVGWSLSPPLSSRRGYAMKTAGGDEEDDEEDGDGEDGYGSYGSSKGPQPKQESPYSKSERTGAKLFARFLQHISVDLSTALDPPPTTSHHQGTSSNNSAADLVHKFVHWLHSSCRAIQEITKPGELAFSLPQIYYHIVDRWEARLMLLSSSTATTAAATQPAQVQQMTHTGGNGSVQLGRAFFRLPKVSSTTEPFYNWKKRTLFTLDRESLSLEFAQTYSKRLATIIRACDVLAETRRYRPTSNPQHRSLHNHQSFKNNHYSHAILDRAELRQDWTYHTLQLTELLGLEAFLLQMVAQVHQCGCLHALEVEDVYDKVRQQQYHQQLQQQQQNQAHLPRHLLSSPNKPPSHLLPLQQQQQWLLPSSGKGGAWQGTQEAQSAYLRSMSSMLYKNALMARLLLPYRYVAVVQVDLYALKEILSLAAKPAVSHPHPSSSASSGGSGNMSGKITGSGSSGNLVSFAHQNNNNTPSATNSSQQTAASTVDTAGFSLAKTFSTGNLGALFSGSTQPTVQTQAPSSTSGTSASSAHGPAAITTSLSGTTMHHHYPQVFGANMGQSSLASQTVSITAANPPHGPSFEVYAIIRLVKYVPHSANQASIYTGHHHNLGGGSSQHSFASHSSLHNMFASSGAASGGIGGGSSASSGAVENSKVPLDGAYLTPVARVEVSKNRSRFATAANSINTSSHSTASTASSQTGSQQRPPTSVRSSTAPTASGTTNAKKAASAAATAAAMNPQGGKYSRVILQQIALDVDYDWRAQALFRFALPEGWTTLLQEDMHTLSSDGKNNDNKNDRRSLPPLKVSITLYERTFFSDSKLGEVEIPLLDLHERNTLHDWFPVVHSDTSSSSTSSGGGLSSSQLGPARNVSLLLYAQTKVRFQLLQTDTPVVGSGQPHSAALQHNSQHSQSHSSMTDVFSKMGLGGHSSHPQGSSSTHSGRSTGRGFDSFAHHLTDRFRSSAQETKVSPPPSTTSSTSTSTGRVFIPLPTMPSFSVGGKDESQVTASTASAAASSYNSSTTNQAADGNTRGTESTTSSAPTTTASNFAKLGRMLSGNNVGGKSKTSNFMSQIEDLF